MPVSANQNLFVISNIRQKYFKGFINYHHDKDDRLLYLELLNFANKLIYYNRDKVIWIKEVQLNSTQDLIELMH